MACFLSSSGYPDNNTRHTAHPSLSVTARSESIPEMHILLVRQIFESFEQLLLMHFTVQSLLVTALVGDIAPCGVYDLKENQSAVSAQQSLDGGKVSGHFRREEEMGANNVAGTVKARASSQHDPGYRG